VTDSTSIAPAWIMWPSPAVTAMSCRGGPRAWTSWALRTAESRSPTTALVSPSGIQTESRWSSSRRPPDPGRQPGTRALRRASALAARACAVGVLPYLAAGRAADQRGEPGGPRQAGGSSSWRGSSSTRSPGPGMMTRPACRSGSPAISPIPRSDRPTGWQRGRVVVSCPWEENPAIAAIATSNARFCSRGIGARS